MKVKHLKALKEELNAHGQLSISAAELMAILDLAITATTDDEAPVALLVSVPKEVESVPTPAPAKKATKAKAAPAAE